MELPELLELNESERESIDLPDIAPQRVVESEKTLDSGPSAAVVSKSSIGAVMWLGADSQIPDCVLRTAPRV